MERNDKIKRTRLNKKKKRRMLNCKRMKWNEKDGRGKAKSGERKAFCGLEVRENIRKKDVEGAWEGPEGILLQYLKCGMSERHMDGKREGDVDEGVEQDVD